MGHGRLAVRRRPRVAILATGDELVRPGEPAGPDQIVASNPFAIAALVADAGGEPLDLGTARDSFADLERSFALARDSGADLLVTLGGASVGEHDLVQSALAREGMELGFWRVALRPGSRSCTGDWADAAAWASRQPSVVHRLRDLFMVPAIRAMLGDPGAGADPTEPAVLGADLPANDARQDYLRATLRAGSDGPPVATAHVVQDSSMLSVLAASDALIVRPPHAPPARAGGPCRVVRLDRRP
jgi:molybdopterin molybdotransferase